jgi:hypothetical protein
MSEILSNNKKAGQVPGEDSVTEEGGEEEEPQASRTTTQEIPTSTANITEEATAPKGAQRQRRTWHESNKRKHS